MDTSLNSIPNLQQYNMQVMSNSTNFYQSSHQSAGPNIVSHQMPSNLVSSSVSPAKEEYESLIVTQMRRIMNEIFAGLDTAATISLEELRVANPDLFQTIRSQAEIEAKSLWLQKLSIPKDGNFHAPIQAHNKRNFEEMQGGTSSGFTDQQRSRFSRTATTGSAAAATAPSHVPDLPLDVVKAFIAETPVIVDLTRAKTLANTLSAMTQQAYAPKVPTKVLESIASKLSQRLVHYIENATVPPPLPSILADSSALHAVENIHPNTDIIPTMPVRAPKPEFRYDYDFALYYYFRVVLEYIN